MKSCNGCQYAEWYKTEKGRLLPSGDGRCTYDFKLPALPQSMMWKASAAAPFVVRMLINRNIEFENHCVYYEREKQ